MSAAALRRTAHWPHVLRAEARALVDPRVSLGFVAASVVLMLGLMGGARTLVGDLAVLMFFFPLLHWRGRASRGSLDQAMPAGTVMHDLVRVACGAADAAFILAAITAIHLWMFTYEARAMGVVPDVSPGYAFIVVANGIAAYLLGSAVLLRARRPGRVLPAAFFVAFIVFLSTGMSFGTASLHTSISPGGGVTRVELDTPLTPRDALLRVAIGAAAVWLAASLGRHGSRGWRWSLPRLFATGALPAHPARAALAVPRRPAAVGVVAARQLAVQAGRMAVPLGVAVVMAVWAAWRETRGGGTFLSGGAWLMPIVFGAFFWPVLVWHDERERRDWDEVHPVDTLTRRLLRAAAGLMWLQAAVLAVVAGCIAGAILEGTITSLGQVPAWTIPGLPLAVLGLYCLGTAWAMLSARPIRTALIGFLVTAQGMMLVEFWMVHGEWTALSPSRAFAPVHFLAPVQDHSMQATVLWIGIAAALAVAAIRWRTRRDLRRPLPARWPAIA